MGDESSAGDGQYGSLVMNENWPVSNGYGFNQSLAFSIPFTYGTPFDVAVTMYSNIRLDSANYDNQNVGYSVTHDAGNTVTWGGTVSVLDNNSAPVDLQDISMNSGSGTNYLAPIPEPSTTVLLLGAGVFGLALVRRRFRRG